MKIYFSEKVELNEKILIHQPYEAEQILLAENASCLAVKTYFKMLDRTFEVNSSANAEFMAPTGKRTKLPGDINCIPLISCSNFH